MVLLYRSMPLVLSSTGLQRYLAQQVYDGQTLSGIFGLQLVLGGIFFLVQLPWSIPKDIRRWKEIKYGRRLKGPVLVTPKQFNKAIKGAGIGIKVDQCKDLLRIPERGEDQHIEIIGDTGSGKTTIIVQMLRQVQTRGHSAIIYDPACEFIERFYSESRGDIILNPLDRRCPYWGPSEELIRRAEARTIAASLFQPTNDRKGEFFVESPQKIFAHLLLDLPTPQQLVEWMSHPEEIDRRIRDTELASLIDPSAPQQRSGVLGSLSLIADSLRLLPRKEDTATEWSAREWSKERKGWIFITSQPADREALRPLHSLWITRRSSHRKNRTTGRRGEKSGVSGRASLREDSDLPAQLPRLILHDSARANIRKRVSNWSGSALLMSTRVLTARQSRRWSTGPVGMLPSLHQNPSH
jgi:type IV secretory pathway TraG/TraD family ATPase VirD4